MFFFLNTPSELWLLKKFALYYNEEDVQFNSQLVGLNFFFFVFSMNRREQVQIIGNDTTTCSVFFFYYIICGILNYISSKKFIESTSVTGLLLHPNRTNSFHEEVKIHNEQPQFHWIIPFLVNKFFVLARECVIIIILLSF